MRGKPVVRVIPIVVAAVALVFAVCGGGAPPTIAAAAQAQVVLKMGHTLPPGDAFDVAATKLAELVAAKSKGQVKVEVFPGGQLGNDRELIEALRLGNVDMSIQGNNNYDTFVPETALFDLPFLYRDRQTAFRALDSPTGQQVWSLVREQIGVRILAVAENGFRQITTAKKPIRTLADLKGLKMRVPQTKLSMDTFKALGTIATPITFTELFTALQAGVVDGQENALGLIDSAKLYEVQKFLMLTNHQYDGAPIAISEKTWKTLTPDQQNWVQQAAIEARDFQRRYVVARDEDLMKKLQAAGMTVISPARDEFVKAVEPVIDSYKARSPSINLAKIVAGQ